MGLIREIRDAIEADAWEDFAETFHQERTSDVVNSSP
jgi:hypothetical protein